jgi:hypothetical protein
MANENRFYRKVNTLEDAELAIRELTDHTYDLRKQIDGHKKTIDQMQKQTSALGTALNTQINGLNVKAVPPTNGQTLVWNAATGQVEWT